MFVFALVAAFTGMGALPVLARAQVAEANPLLSARLSVEGVEQAAALTKALGISEAQAMQDVHVEDAVGNLNATIEEALGETYAEVWFDPWHGRFDIGVAPSTEQNLSMVRPLLAARGVGSVTDFIPVKDTHQQLVAAEAGWTARVGSLMRAQQAATMIDASTNAVVVELSDQTATPEVSALEQAVSTDSANVRIHIVPASSLQMQSASTLSPCEFTSRPAEEFLSDYCDPPFIGGTEIFSSPSPGFKLCTAGFQAQSIEPQRYPDHYLITAAHCFNGGYGFEHLPWGSANHLEQAHAIGYLGYRYEDYRGDAAFIDLSLEKGYWQDISPQGWDPYVYTPGEAWGPSTETETYFINYVGTNDPPNIQYQTPCHVGAASGVRCGVTEYTNVSGVNKEGYEVGSLVQNSACGIKGDSGGPWICNNYAMGIHVSGHADCTPGGGGGPTWFDDLHETDHNLGLRVVGWQGTTE